MTEPIPPDVQLRPLQAAQRAFDIVEYKFDESQTLSVKVFTATKDDRREIYTYSFNEPGAVLQIHEMDLDLIWSSQHYKTVTTLYEVTGESLFAGFAKRPGLFNISLAAGSQLNLREFLIATNDTCLVCLAPAPPVIEVSYEDFPV